MIKKLFCGLVMLMATGFAAFAASTHTLTINGQTVDQVVKQISFDGDNVVLHFSDGTSQSSDMAAVEIAFNHQQSGIGDVDMFTFNGYVEGGVLVVEGVEAGAPVEIYNLSGVQVLASVAAEGRTELAVDNLQAGVYVLRAGNNVVKFVKR